MFKCGLSLSVPVSSMVFGFWCWNNILIVRWLQVLCILHTLKIALKNIFEPKIGIVDGVCAIDVGTKPSLGT